MFTAREEKEVVSQDSFGNSLERPFVLPCGDWVGQLVSRRLHLPSRGSLARWGWPGRTAGAGLGPGPQAGHWQRAGSRGEWARPRVDTQGWGGAGGQLPGEQDTKAKRLNRLSTDIRPKSNQPRSAGICWVGGGGAADLSGALLWEALRRTGEAGLRPGGQQFALSLNREVALPCRPLSTKLIRSLFEVTSLKTGSFICFFFFTSVSAA